MKNFSFIFVALFAFVFTQCKEDPYKEIKQDFKLYVNENFDNPKDLETIISISDQEVFCVDSFLNKGYVMLEMYDDVRCLADSLDSVMAAEFEMIQKKEPRLMYYIRNNHDNSYVKGFITNFMGQMALKLENPTTLVLDKTRKKMVNLIEDSTQIYNVLTKRTIKYRIKYGDSMRLDSVYYLTKNGGVPYISRESIKISELGGRIEEFNPMAKECLEVMELNNKRIEMLRQAKQNLEFIRLKVK